MFFVGITLPTSIEAVMYSAKKGVGGEGAPDLANLGVSWAYTWYPCENCFNNVYEHVPMIWGASYDSNVVTRIARNHPGGYWLIWNEPNYWRQANISPTAAAQIYRSLRPLIKGADQRAKLIVGGVLFLDVGWLENFRSEYHRLYNEWPVVEGWHVHQYVGATEYGVGKTITASEWQRRLQAVHTWMDNPANGGPVELWLTEYGCLNSEPVAYQLMQDQASWLESQPWITRYAWFASWSDGEGCPGCTGALFEITAPYRLTRLGQYYASVGQAPTSTPTTSPTPTFTPTPTVTPPVDSCPRGDLGNLNCEIDGKIDGTDLDILLRSWGPVPTPVPNFHSADIAPAQLDQQVNALDLDKLLNSWGTGSD